MGNTESGQIGEDGRAASGKGDLPVIAPQSEALSTAGDDAGAISDHQELSGRVNGDRIDLTDPIDLADLLVTCTAAAQDLGIGEEE